ncbi:MAG: N-6 DNA methylase [Methylococcales bacterium]|nr:N-6 DNA methylase [Methylococcales bacterium]MDP3840658.1 N-6 DNA methylase [Methylococcales bacterium]
MSATIQNYYRKLDDLRRIAGASNEGALRSAFQTLLETIGSEHSLILYNEYPFKAPNGAALRADGVLMDSLRQIHGWWEAKDEKDDLNKEIEVKLAKGYPRDNIIFEDTRTAVLMQNGEQAMTCAVNDAAQLQRLLNSFFDYESPEVASFRIARAKFLTELPQVAAALTELLSAARRDNAHFRQQSAAFLQLCQRSIGERVTAQNVDEMLIQHILTDQIFRAVFPDSRFHAENHLARAIGDLENSFFRGETRVLLLKRVEPYFAAIRLSAARTQTSADKQDFLKHIYEDFYSAYNPKDADKLGVVYTPKEAVRFMIEACDWLTQKHFKKRLSDSGLEILDPCMGTGTFIVDLLDYWRGDQQALSYKFAHELHANEISILPYYIASLNIEQTYYEITGQWREFSGACFVNTLDNWGFEQTHSGAQFDLFGSVTDENHARIEAQNARKIPIIIGNPPYNANQQNENDNNKNDAAPTADRRIKETYLADSTAQKTKLYDPYLRFFRWASDRLGEEGVLAFITNRSYLDSRQADGFRKTVAKEFQEIWIVDLMSDVRKNPKISGTKHNIFGIQAGVAIAFLVRTASPLRHRYLHKLTEKRTGRFS